MNRSTFARGMIVRLFLILALAVVPASVPFQAVRAAGVRHVKPTASGSGDCSSWANACTLQTALTGASSGDEIWVAAGTYIPTSGSSRTATFQLVEGVAVYAGFAATGDPAWEDRNPTMYSVNLSGDIGASGNRADNSFHVVTGADGATLDGVIIYGGNANGVSPNDNGAGMFNESGSPTLTNVIFYGNIAENYGGGMYNDSGNPMLTEVNFGLNGASLGGGMFTYSGSPTLSNVTFSFNNAQDGGGMYSLLGSPVLTEVSFSSNTAESTGGGGMYNASSSPILNNVTFDSNDTYGSGGGMANESSSPMLNNVTFLSNQADYWAGGMYNIISTPTLNNVTFSGNSADSGGGMFNYSSNTTLTNVTFSGNSVTSWGGGMANGYNSSPTLTNVTFKGNTADDTGGGMYNWQGIPAIRNTILWGNTAPTGAQIYNSSSTPTLRDSVVQGGYAGGTNIITADPLLGGLGAYGGSTKTIPLLPGSSAINAGNSTYCTMGQDQRGVSYVGVCDIGAFESRGFTLTKTGGDGQATLISTAFAQPLTLTVASAFGEPVNGGKVTFTAPPSGASTNPATNTATIVSGAVSQSLTANGTAGAYTVAASASGATPVNFSLRNLASLILYAKPGGVTSGACASWANACELRYALSSAVSGQEIWVAAGTYTPGTTRTATFQLKSGVAVYGGFAGTETSRNQRNPATNVAVLSGDIGTVGNASDNSYHVVTGADGAILEGVTISGGNANGGSPNNHGGGMYNNSGSPTLANVIFSSNSAQYGGGMYNNGSAPTLTNVSFSGNTAQGEGGGMLNEASSNPTLTNVSFSGNSAGVGGGMATYSSSPILTNVTFKGNSAGFGGGGMYNDTSSPQIRNAIVWGNSGGQISNYNSGTVVSDSVVQGGYAGGTNIITADPLLGTLGNYGGSTQTFPLLPGSSAIDAGNDATCAATDPRGVTRPQGSHCDIGAFESRGFTLTKTGGDGQATLISTAFAQPLTLTVASAFGEPVNGGKVTFTAPPSGASTNPATNTATTAGSAVSQSLTANGTAGAYTVTASASGATPASFALVNLSDTLYAQPGGLTSGACASWANACELRYALSSAVSGEEIWVAAGTYTPGTTRTATFQLKSGVAVYGGFDGTETSRDQRDPAANVVSLSGDLNGDDIGFTNNGENSYHVVTGADGAILEGVTISGGNANGSAPNDIGGGMYNDTGSPTLTNISFSSNHAGYSGGGIYNDSGSPTLSHVTFNGNSAQYGGGMMDSGSSTLTNVTFSSNSATDYGGGMVTHDGSPMLTNATFSANTATNYGGGLYTDSGSPTIRNTILWDNTASTGAQIFNSASTPVVNDSVVQDGYAGGTHIITDDPLLGPLGDNGGYTQTLPLQANSSAIDTGNDSVCPASDQRGVARPQGARCDIGAFEHVLNGAQPTVTEFTVASPSTTHAIPVTAFSATPDPGVTGYLITTSSTPPPADAVGWTVTAPTSFTVAADGTYTLYPWVKNADGNGSTEFASPPAVAVDATAPNTQIDSHPSDPANSTSASFTFSSPDDASATFECQLDSGGYSACDSPKNYTSLSEGEHTFYVRAKDPIGNTDPSPASFAWTIDTTAPNTQIDSHPSNPTNSTSASFTFSSPDGTATFECQLDNGDTIPCTSPQSYTSLSEGEHTFNVRAKDPIGNTDPNPASYTWMIDLTAPDTRIDSHPSDPTNSTSASFTFSSPGDATATFQCSLDGGAYAACTSPKNYSGLSEGEHTFDVRARDAAGNTDPSPASFAWTVDTTQPSVVSSLRADPDPTDAASLHFTVTFSEPVINVDLNDFSLTTSGISGASVTGVSGSGSVYSVAVSSGSGNGTIRLDLPASATISDEAGNSLANLPYTSGDTYTVSKVFTLFLPLVFR